MKMPVKKVKGGYWWGTKGKIYASKKAERQGKAIEAIRKGNHGKTKV